MFPLKCHRMAWHQKKWQSQWACLKKTDSYTVFCHEDRFAVCETDNHFEGQPFSKSFSHDLNTCVCVCVLYKRNDPWWLGILGYHCVYNIKSIVIVCILYIQYCVSCLSRFMKMITPHWFVLCRGIHPTNLDGKSKCSHTEWCHHTLQMNFGIFMQ